MTPLERISVITNSLTSKASLKAFTITLMLAVTLLKSPVTVISRVRSDALITYFVIVFYILSLLDCLVV